MNCKDSDPVQIASSLRLLRAIGNLSVTCFAAICALWVSDIYTPPSQIMFLIPLIGLLVSWSATVLGARELTRQPREGSSRLAQPKIVVGLARGGLSFGILSFAIFFVFGLT